MASVREILKTTGLTDEQIAALDTKAMSAFDGMVTSAEADKKAATEAQVKAQADFNAAKEAVTKAEQERKDAIAQRELAELQGRSNTEFYEQKIVPGLTSWDDEKAKLENERTKALAEAAYYRTQNEGARSGGFIPTDAPGYVSPKPDAGRDGNGRYVAGTEGGTPGSPTYMDPTKLAAEFSNKAGLLTDISWRYSALNGGAPMPIPPSQLIAEADAQKLDVKAYAEKRFGFSQREAELNATRQREHEAKLTADAAAAEDAKWQEKMKTREAEFAAEKKQLSEKHGNNPDVRVPAGSAKFADIKRAVETGELPNPLKMTDAQRRAATRQQIHSAIDARETAAV